MRMCEHFKLPLSIESSEYTNYWCVPTGTDGYFIDESGDGGFHEDTCEAIVLAINQYDSLIELLSIYVNSVGNSFVGDEVYNKAKKILEMNND